MHREIVSTKGSHYWQGVPAIERAPNGRLWCAMMTGGILEPRIENYIALTTRAADEQTWTELGCIIAPRHLTRTYDQCLWHAPDGRLFIFYNHSHLETRHGTVWYMTTDDASGPDPVWSTPQQIELDVPFAYRLNKPTVLSNGDWLLPVTYTLRAPHDWFPNGGQLQGVAISSDAGATWDFCGAVEAPHWAFEHMIVELRDRRLWMLIRTGSGVLWQSFSEDGGRTWSKGKPSEFVNPGVRFHLRRLASGRLLFINTPNPTRRQGLLAYLSDPADEMHFLGGLQLDARDNVSYPDTIQAPDGTIYAVHDCERGRLGEVILDTFTEADILAAAD